MKRKEQQKLIREQSDKTLKQFSILSSVNRPARGWIRAIRDALGMNMRQFAGRLGVHSSRIPRIEQDELTGSLTLKTMHRVADELDCVFVYGFVPRSSLEDTVKKQAIYKAREKINRIMHTMNLEAQNLEEKNRERIFKSIVDDILDSPSSLWDENNK
jgi:predicted DNA-binding mobile mystery protein A